MLLPEDAPAVAEAWYDAFRFMVELNLLIHPGHHEVAFSRRLAVGMTRLSEPQEHAAAKWLLRHGYVRATGFYKAYGKTCNLLSLGPGPEIELPGDVDLLDEEEEADVTAAA